MAYFLAMTMDYGFHYMAFKPCLNLATNRLV